MQTDELNRRIAYAYLGMLTNREVPHDRLFITFSGVPGSGKTTLAKKLVNDLTAQYVRHDDIRAMIREEGHDPTTMDIALVSRTIVNMVLETDNNKRIILDSSIDRKWDGFFRYAKQSDAKTIVIRMNVSKNTLRKRLERRDKADVGNRENLDTFIEQFNDCKKHVTADIELVARYSYKAVLKRLEQLDVERCDD